MEVTPDEGRLFVAGVQLRELALERPVDEEEEEKLPVFKMTLTGDEEE